MRYVIVVACVAALLSACASAPTPTERQPTPTTEPTATATPPALIPGGAAAPELSARAQLFAEVLTLARYEESHAMTSPRFRASCSLNQWISSLIVTSNFMRAFGRVDQEGFLEWSVSLVNVTGEQGSVLMAVSHAARQLTVPSADSWAMVDGVWYYDAPLEAACI